MDTTKTCTYEVDTMPGVYTNQDHWAPCGRPAVGIVTTPRDGNQLVCKVHARYWTKRNHEVRPC